MKIKVRTFCSCSFFRLINGTKTLSNSPPSAPDLELIINQKIKDSNSFNNSLQNINLMMKYYEEQNNKNKKKYKNLKI